MPPKVKITKEDIIRTSLGLVRKKGAGNLNARTVASLLGCSTQPVFSNFATMDELQEAVARAAFTLYMEFLKNEAKKGEYPRYKSFGMAYIRFAKEEKEFFKLLFMCERDGKEFEPGPDYTESIEMISAANGISNEKAEKLHLEMWACVHGIATMLATSYLDLSRELISDMISDIYHGLVKQHLEAHQ